MNRPRMMAFWMEVALKVRVVAPELPTVMYPSLASPSSSTRSAHTQVAKRATVKIFHIIFKDLWGVWWGGFGEKVF